MTHDSMSGRVVIVTGGAGAVGSTVSRRWLEAGASVLVVDHRQETIDRWLSSSPEFDSTGRVATLATDVTSESGARKMVAEATRSFDAQPDTLIHLVGGFGAAAVESDSAPSTMEKMIALNLTSAFQCYRAMLPALRERKGGWIVGISSKAARNPGPNISAYAASKSGLEAFTTSLSAEVRTDGIHVNLIVATTIDTADNRKAMGADKASAWVSPDDIADATLFLCSESARSAHGTTLEVFGQSG